MKDYLILAVLDAMDSATTAVGLKHGVPEGNPIALSLHNFGAMAAFKAEWSALIFCLLILLTARYDRGTIVGFACWIFALAVVNNLLIIGVS